MNTTDLFGSSQLATTLALIGGNQIGDLRNDLLKQAIVAAANKTGGGGGGGSGTVTRVSFTGGLISVATPTTTPALTVAGTSGGIPYFSAANAWASSALLAANALMVGGGAGAAPATATTGANVLTALGVAVGSAGAFVVNGGTLGTPTSGTLTNCTGLPAAGVVGTAAILGANIFTGEQYFNSTTIAGLRANNLTTTQKNALTAAAGMMVYDTTLSRMQSYDGAAWRSHVRLDGDTMTGTLTGTIIIGTSAIQSNGYVDIHTDSAIIYMGTSSDCVISRRSAGTLRLGLDAASSQVSQILAACGARVGTDTNTTPTNTFTLAGSPNTGTGTGGDLRFGVYGTNGSSGTAIGTLNTVLTIVAARKTVNISSIPTSSAGLSSGDIYSNAGILTIV